MSRFVLLVPTYNRPRFVERLLGHLGRVGFAHPILVADSSDDGVFAENARTAARAGVRHLRFPTTTSPFTKIADALDTTNAPFAAICADDDFLVPGAIDECVDWLAAHSDYSIAHGRAVVFSPLEAPGLTGRRVRTTHYRQCEVDNGDPVARLAAHLGNYATTFYSVHRRGELIRNMRVIAARTSDYRFAEVLASALSLVQGKARRLERLYMVRTDNPVRVSLKTSESLVRTWDALLLDPTFGARYAEFRAALLDELREHGTKPGADAAVDRAFIRFLASRIVESPGPVAALRDAARQVERGLRAALTWLRLGRPASLLTPAATLRSLRDEVNPMSVSRLLSRSRYRADFHPIYETMKQSP